jgi:hypothetical protein
VETAIRAWFFANWMYAGAVAALFLLALVPLLAGAMSLALLATYLHLPVYMVHQVEEHAGDRFRTFVNKWLGHGKDVLPTPAIVLINVPGVWGVTLTSLYLAAFADIGLGLIAVYLVLVNALTHVGAAIALRRYNPGLVTAVVLFLPFGLWALWVIGSAPGVGWTDHAIGLGIAIAIHVGIIAYVRRRASLLGVS